MEYFDFNHEKKKETKISFFSGERCLLTLSEDEGIHFHRENFPDLKADQFASEFIKILENHFNISFHDKSNEDFEISDIILD